MAAIKILPAIINSEFMQKELPAEAKELYILAKEYIKDQIKERPVASQGKHKNWKEFVMFNKILVVYLVVVLISILYAILLFSTTNGYYKEICRQQQQIEEQQKQIEKLTARNESLLFVIKQIKEEYKNGKIIE